MPNNRQLKFDIWYRFNQTLVSYDASKEEKVAVLNQHKQKLQERLREELARPV
jgi:hypothetical protein